jgi:hypothetical protein
MDTGNILSPIKCEYCASTVSEQDQFCINCGFPLKGSEGEQRQFISTKNYKHHEIKELTRKTKNAQITLFVLAGLFFVIGVIYYFLNKDSELAFAAAITNLILAAIFLALGGWAKNKPVVSIISGLVLYILVQLISIVDDPTNIGKGIILKIIVIVYLVRGLQSAMEVEKIKKEHNIS